MQTDMHEMHARPFHNGKINGKEDAIRLGILLCDKFKLLKFHLNGFERKKMWKKVTSERERERSRSRRKMRPDRNEDAYGQMFWENAATAHHRHAIDGKLSLHTQHSIEWKRCAICVLLFSKSEILYIDSLRFGSSFSIILSFFFSVEIPKWSSIDFLSINFASMRCAGRYSPSLYISEFYFFATIFYFGRHANLSWRKRHKKSGVCSVTSITHAAHHTNVHTLKIGKNAIGQFHI